MSLTAFGSEAPSTMSRCTPQLMLPVLIVILGLASHSSLLVLFSGLIFLPGSNLDLTYDFYFTAVNNVSI